MDIANPVRKGQVVAIEIEHSSHDVRMKRTAYTLWHLAYVEQASRDGLCRRIRFPGQFHSLDCRGFGKVHAIGGDRQAAAKALADSIKYPGRDFASADELRQAILAMSAKTDIPESQQSETPAA
jgi:hypothetical protein